MANAQFTADPRLLQLLVGSQLYPSPDVFVRELLQNAHDAIIRRGIADGRVEIRYSPAQRWVEVSDNGCGMTEQQLIDAFLTVGAEKERDAGSGTSEEVGFFGIGVLSVFLVARRLSVSTAVGTTTGHAFETSGLYDQIDIREEPRPEGVGTTVRVELMADASFDLEQLVPIVRRYARHDLRVICTNSDSAVSEEVAEVWDLGDDFVRISFSSDTVRSGQLGLSRSLVQPGGVVANPIRLCNAGFLVEDRALDLLPLQPVGLVGELNLHPGLLTIHLSREQFQRDEKWSELGASLFDPLEELMVQVLEEPDIQTGLGAAGIRQLALVWYQQLSGQPQLQQLRAKIERFIAEKVVFRAMDGREVMLADVAASAPNSRAYYRPLNFATAQDRSLNDEGVPIRWQEEVSDAPIAGSLAARGFTILQAQQLTFNAEMVGQVQGHSFDDMPSVAMPVLSALGCELRMVTDAEPSDLDLSGFDEAPAVRELLELPGSPIRIARIGGSGRRSVLDPSGVRYLNVGHPGMRRALRQLGRSYGNPLRRALFDALMALEEFRTAEARELLLKVLEDDQLERRASLTTAPETAAALSAALEAVIERAERLAGERDLS